MCKPLLFRLFLEVAQKIRQLCYPPPLFGELILAAPNSSRLNLPTPTSNFEKTTSNFDRRKNFSKMGGDPLLGINGKTSTGVPPAKLDVHHDLPLDVVATSSINFKNRAPILANSNLDTDDPLLLEEGEIAITPQINVNPTELISQTDLINGTDVAPCPFLAPRNSSIFSQLSLKEREIAAVVATARVAGIRPILSQTQNPAPIPSQLSPGVQGPTSDPTARTTPQVPIPAKSYAEAASPGHSSSSATLGTVDRTLEISEAIFTLPERTQASVDLRHAIVGKFSFGKPTNQAIRSNLSKMGFIGCKLDHINARHVMNSFRDEQMCSELWLRRELLIGKFLMRVFK